MKQNSSANQQKASNRAKGYLTAFTGGVAGIVLTFPVISTRNVLQLFSNLGYTPSYPASPLANIVDPRIPLAMLISVIVYAVGQILGTFLALRVRHHRGADKTALYLTGLMTAFITIASSASYFFDYDQPLVLVLVPLMPLLARYLYLHQGELRQKINSF